MSDINIIQDIYAEVKSWQTGLGALIGMGSLAFVAWYNFHLNRKRDRAQREAEAQSIAAAIYSEIILLRNQLALLARIVANAHARDRELVNSEADVYRPSKPVIFPSLSGRLGQLDPDLVIGISKFFSDLEEATRGWDVITTPRDPSRFSYLIVLQPCVSGVKGVRPVLAKIQHMLGLPEVAEPHLGDADQVIDREEEMFRSPRMGDGTDPAA